VTASEFSRGVMAQAAWQAAQNETHQVMLSVLMVFKNRAEAGWFDGSLYLNCAQWLIENPPKAMPDERDPQFLNLLSKLDGVVAGLVPDKVAGALWFAPKSECEAIAGRIVATVGQMNFISQ